MRKWRWILVSVLAVLVATGIVLRRYCRSLFGASVHLTIECVPSYWVRALIVWPLRPEWSFYRFYDTSVFPAGNALIEAISKTGPYAEGLLHGHLSSPDPEVRLFAALALLEMGHQGTEVRSELRDLILLAQLAQSDDYYYCDVAIAYMAAEALAKRGEVVGFDYIASCLERTDEIGRRARWDYVLLFSDVLGESPVCDGLYDLDYGQSDPAFGKPAREWYLRNREAIVRELSALRAAKTESPGP